MKRKVEGFSLFVLCHFFGKRGRTMVSSLARQVNCVVPIQLFAFYARKEDADLLREGAASGLNPPLLNLLATPSGQIMQRAMHFSRAQDMHGLSHTVFCDADLWFPPTFWSEYAQALEAELPGYWSSKVHNVPWPQSEGCVEKWSGVQEEDLARTSTGPYREEYFGRVGHFQCIPRTLLAYPTNPQPGVANSDLVFSNLAIRRSANLQVERRIGTAFTYHLDHPVSWEGTHGVQL